MGDIIDAAQELEYRLRTQSLACHRVRFAELVLENCVECGEPIPDARRKALSGALRCIDCQNELETGSRL
ncbi:TraR/DksA family transcriptional regulator [Thalassospira marina]|uniref:Conjugal transfer protein TraR n=1 Tax=Thalassospira marina TaxID=2048283 RepID=A0ABM6QBI0_9PROT|nr:TraR/DksA family transcriptional regulator [Thalassospira marina]AUG53925.1 conjugal transfer protein TraR [Thalassospira marina]